MSIEDRVRAATRARTDLVSDIRPLELPDELPARGRARRPAARRWLSWGAPVAAAALVTAVALALVLLRQAGGPQPAPAAPAPPSAAASIPRYYVAPGPHRQAPARRRRRWSATTAPAARSRSSTRPPARTSTA